MTLSAGTAENPDCISAVGKVPHHHNECPEYDNKQSDGEAPVILGLWGIQSILSLLSHPVPLWPGVVAPDTV